MEIDLIKTGKCVWVQKGGGGEKVGSGEEGKMLWKGMIMQVQSFCTA